ncbi:MULTISPECIES: hypothetical protein [Microbacterium]|uniref:hypothetical protein n=1 Tax=Microbacterium TaxID=33882 RepID=UPI001E2F86B2|nr:hypothetical protein [Microbacterium nymphoidis]MCD2499209.1 hypothetical protein [Microbacterium nymphoidis]
MELTGFVVTCGAAALVALLVTLGAAPRSVQRFGDRRDLPRLAPAAFAAVVRQLRTSTLWAMAAIAVCLVSAVSIAWHLGTDVFAGWALLLLIYPAVAIATAIHSALHRTFRPAPGGSRVAPTRSLGIEDAVPAPYAAFPDRLLWVVVVAAVAATIAVSLTSASALIWAVGVILAALAAILFGFRLLERAVLSRPQPLQDRSELAWDRALRTQTLFMLRQVQAGVVITAIGAVVAVPLAGALGPEAVPVCLAFSAAGVNFVIAAYAMRIDQSTPAPAARGESSA